MHDSNLVSIIIPFYNASKFLEETILSCLNQTYQNLEIVLVDDGSTDNSLELAKSFKDSRIKVFTQPNSGAPAARNLGLSKATGDYIQFLDGDDLLADNKIESQLFIAKSSPKSLVFCPHTRKFEDFKKKAYLKESIHKHYLSPVDFLCDIFYGKGNILIHSFLIPLSIIKEVPKWDESLIKGQDGQFMTNVILKFDNIIFSNETLVYYRISGINSIAINKSMESVESIIKSTKLIYNSVVSYEDSLKVNHAFIYLFSRHYCSFFHLGFVELNDSLEKEIFKLNGNIIFHGNKTLKILSKILGVKNVLKIKSKLKNNL